MSNQMNAWDLIDPDPRPTPKMHSRDNPPEHGNTRNCYICGKDWNNAKLEDVSRLYYNRADELGGYLVFIQLCDQCYHYHITLGL